MVTAITLQNKIFPKCKFLKGKLLHFLMKEKYTKHQALVTIVMQREIIFSP